MLTSICCNDCGKKIQDPPTWLELADVEVHAAARAIVYFVQNGGVRYGKVYADPESAFLAILGTPHRLFARSQSDDLAAAFKLNRRLALSCASLCTSTSVDRLELRPVFDFFRNFTQNQRQSIVYLLESRYDMGYTR